MQRIANVVLFGSLVVLQACTGSPSGTQQALILSIQAGNQKAVEGILKSKPDIDVNWQAFGVGPTPLMTAVAANQVEIAKILIARGADPNIAGRKGFTPLQDAAHYGKVELVRLLIAAHADVNAVEKSYGYSPLASAAARGHPEVVGMLLAAGADPHYRISDGRSIEQLALYSGDPQVISLVRVALARGSDSEVASPQAH